MVVVRGTCSACASYKQGRCQAPNSSFRGRLVWAIACVQCGGYRRDGEARVGEAKAAAEMPRRH